MDGKAAESFGGMRVVRAFSRQRAETSRFMNTNHLMGRQELNTWWWARSMEVVWGLLIPVGCLSVLLLRRQASARRPTHVGRLDDVPHLPADACWSRSTVLAQKRDAVSEQPLGARPHFGFAGRTPRNAGVRRCRHSAKSRRRRADSLGECLLPIPGQRRSSP